MVIKFETKLRDMLYFNARSFFRLPNLFIFLLLCALNIAFKYDEYSSKGITAYIIYSLVFVLVFFLFVMLLTMVFVLISLAGKGFRSVLCERVMEFNEDGFMEKTVFNESKYSWQAVNRYIVTSGYILVYVSSSAAHIIPRRALTPDEVSTLTGLLEVKTARRP